MANEFIARKGYIALEDSQITGSLSITGDITGSTFSGSFVGDGSQLGGVTTASYVEYNDIANKPTLVSGSEQISFNGITDKPTLVSGSSQITYSGLTGVPSGIVSGSAQIAALGYATTGSNGFNGNQAITGSLTVTGQVIAQSLNVQQVTSSIVYSSGSNVFGSDLGNTQQLTGSVSITGSLTVNGVAAGTVRSVGLSSLTSGVTIGGSPITTSGSLTLAIDTATSTMNGLLSSTDWSTFNNKENAISAGTTAQYYRGDKTFQTLNTAAVTESTNLYYTEARVNANTNVAANTAARHAAVTLGTANGLSLSTQQLSLGLASTSTNGALSSTDWNTFNGKQAALNGTGFVKISGTTISYDNSTYLTAESDTLATVTGRGASTSTNLTFNGTLTMGSLLQVNGPGGTTRADTHGISLWNGGVDYRISFDSVGGTVGYIRYNVDTANSTAHGHIFSAGDYNGTPTNYMLIRADGRVGIGTTNPAKLLTVGSSTASSGIGNNGIFVNIDGGAALTTKSGTSGVEVQVNAEGSTQGTIGTYSNHPLSIRTNNSNVMWFTTGGNVGIGTTDPSFSSGTYPNKLYVNGSSQYFGVLTVQNAINTGDVNHGIINLYNSKTAAVGDDARIMFTFKNADGSIHPRASMGAINAGDYAASLQFNTRDLSAAYTEKMRLTYDGKLGINTTSPSSRLSVCSTTACSTVVDVQGCAGQLFSITDNLVGEIFAVSDISGIPILSVNSNGTVSVDSKIAVGANHTVSGAYASVLGGVCNTASGFVSTVGGGFGNTASGCYSTVAGGGGCFGGGNSATSKNSTVSGGSRNTSSSYYSTVGGGRENCSSGNFSTIAGGFRNTASGYASVIAGGGGCFNPNCSTATNSTVGGGRGNNATANTSTISGGLCNTASGTSSFVGGGLNNTANGGGTTIGGGRANTASCYCSIVGGGCGNIANGSTSTVGGGRANTASGQCSTVSGGSCNTASNYYSAVLGGFCNLAFGNTSTVGGGFNNRACGYTSIAGGGNNNTASGYAASVLGGRCNTASGTFSAVGNGNAQTASSCNEFRVSFLSKASGTFRIDHPDPSKKFTHYLSHSFVESPTAGDNIYRYKVNIVNGQAVITLPSYYKYLNENDQIWVTPQGHFGIGYGTINKGQTQLTIYGNTDGEYNVLLIGTRKDTDAVEHWQGTETYK